MRMINQAEKMRQAGKQRRRRARANKYKNTPRRTRPRGAGAGAATTAAEGGAGASVGNPSFALQAGQSPPSSVVVPHPATQGFGFLGRPRFLGGSAGASAAAGAVESVVSSNFRNSTPVTLSVPSGPDTVVVNPFRVIVYAARAPEKTAVVISRDAIKGQVAAQVLDLSAESVQKDLVPLL